MEKAPGFPQKPRFTIKESAASPKRIESGVPNVLTRALLEKFPAAERSSFDSGKIEDFLISALGDGLTVSEIGERARVSSLEADIIQIQERAVSEEIECTINDLTNDVSVERVKEGIIEEMRNLGATNVQIEALKEVVVNFDQQPGTSMAGSTSVTISIPQVLRKAFDAVQSLQMDIAGLPHVIEIIMKRTIAHELGHTVDRIMDIISNSVEQDERWGSPEQSEENRSERFAEFIGVSQLGASEVEISQKERLLNVAKSKELWDAIIKYNATHSPNVGLNELFAAIDNTFDAAAAKAFVTSRRYLYSTARPENYAMPYTREQIQRTRRVEI